MAPSTIRKMPTPMLIVSPPSIRAADGQAS
jgi:hypothetical protein